MYGTAAPVHSRDPKKFQHQGIGTLLMEEAERIAREEHGSGRIAVISGMYPPPPAAIPCNITDDRYNRCGNSRLLSTTWLLP